MTVGGWIQRELKRFGSRRSQDSGSNNFNLGGDITRKAEEMQIEALEGLTRGAKEMYGERISFPQ